MHVLRPLIVFLGLVAVLLLVRTIMAPPAFGIHNGDYTYGWYDQANQATAESPQVKYKGREYCQGCHSAEASQIAASFHSVIQCENCHGPATNHPTDPPKLTIDRSRDLCLRCHAALPSSLSGRAGIQGIDPATHNTGIACVSCHKPHSPKKGAL